MTKTEDFLIRNGIVKEKPEPEVVHDTLMGLSDEEFLAHFGVKGMRWGVRRSAAQLAGMSRGDAKKAAKAGAGKEYSEDSKQALTALTKAKTHGLSSLSNQELQVLNSRLNLEKNYNKLNPPEKTRGQKILDAAIKTGKFGIKAYALYNSPLGKQISASLSKKSEDAVADAVSSAGGGSKKAKKSKPKKVFNVSDLPPTSQAKFTVPDDFGKAWEMRDRMITAG